MIEFVSHEWWSFFFRWLHIISGIMWIGHLWYFNFTQTPTMPKIPAELKPGVTKYILPEALFWFRWSAMLTIITGLIVAAFQGELLQALTLGIGQNSPHFTAIGFGMWFGIIMWFNVWFIIWPNQKKNMGLVEVTPEQKAKAARIAGLTSRANTLLSIPMLYCMASVHVY
ncbi:MAG TPA: urate hydroxylase PuuD [Magnetospirillaceae bacterium]|jgi:uncharacterized membrane protein